jgi:hypothetical protein
MDPALLDKDGLSAQTAEYKFCGMPGRGRNGPMGDVPEWDRDGIFKAMGQSAEAGSEDDGSERPGWNPFPEP